MTGRREGVVLLRHHEVHEFWSIRTESRSIWVGYDDGTKATSVSQAQTHLEVLISVYYSITQDWHRSVRSTMNLYAASKKCSLPTQS
jgi:hypothetical protein